MGKKDNLARLARRKASIKQAKNKAMLRKAHAQPDKVQELQKLGALKKKAHKASRNIYRSKKAREERRQEKQEAERQKRLFIQNLVESGISTKFLGLAKGIGLHDISSLLSKGRLLDTDNPKDAKVINLFNKKRPSYLSAEVFAVLEFEPTPEYAAIAEEPTPLWHGTKPSAAINISREGFRLPLWLTGMLGPGIYGAPRLHKAANYIREKKDGYGFIFLADFKLGKVVKTNHFGVGKKAYDEVLARKGNSAFAEAGQYVGSWRGHIYESEYAVYDIHRVHARYLFILKYPKG